MKFLCHTEFIHGVRIYTAGGVYSDFTAGYAEELIALDKKKPLGALSFFTPADDEAVNFLKAAGAAVPPAAGISTGEGTGGSPKPPTRIELIAEAKSLGIKGADRMSVDELKEAVTAAKQQTDTPSAAGSGEGKDSAA
jgi:hypothetical protein